MTEPRDPAAPHQGSGDAPRLIAGRYRLGPVIGRGGMAIIHRAFDTRLDRAVAIKLLRPEVSRDPDLAQRFRREALAATVLRHPNIVACIDTGTDGDQPFLVMDLVEGEDLAARLKRGGRLAPRQVARIGLDVARGLAVAHVRGIVHRDIKPGNILLAADGRAMVADFGIARLALDAEATLPGTTLGSVHYFSPEQARGLTTTPASDVYGLGLVLYEALTGARAWTGDTTDAIALARVGAAPPVPSARVAGVPAALEAVVLRALAPEPRDRFVNGAAMARALEPIVAATDLSAPELATAPPATAPPATAPLMTAPPPPAPPLVTAPPPPAPPLVPPSSGAHQVAAGGAPSIPAPGRGRRPGGTATALLALAIGASLLGGVLVAALPNEDGVASATRRPGATAASPSGRPARTPAPTQTVDPTPAPTPERTSTPEPTETPGPTPPGPVADLCESFFGLPCGLDAGRYAPARFDPAFDVKLGDGWSNAAHGSDVVSLARSEGSMTFFARLAEVYPTGGARPPRDQARDIIEAFVVTDGISSTRPAKVRIGDRKGFSVDVSPIEDRRVKLFATGSSAYFLEPVGTTRVVVMDVRGTAVVIVIEPTAAFDLRAILDTADDAAGTIRWR